jgi:hypothetical protein
MESLRMAASRREAGDPAGRGPSATWRFRKAKAACSSKRSTLGRGFDAAETPAARLASRRARARRVHTPSM